MNFKICLLVFLALTAGMFFYREDLPATRMPDAVTSECFYIQDYSHVFSGETENYVASQSIALRKATKGQIVVVSVPNTQADTLETYSVNLANHMGVGDAELDNGILLLFTTDEPHVRLEVGNGLEGRIPDAKAGRILDDYAVESKNARRWDKAAVDTFNAVAREIYAEYGKEPPASLTSAAAAAAGKNGTGSPDSDTRSQKRENEASAGVDGAVRAGTNPVGTGGVIAAAAAVAEEPETAPAGAALAKIASSDGVSAGTERKGATDERSGDVDGGDAAGTRETAGKTRCDLDFPEMMQVADLPLAERIEDAFLSAIAMILIVGLVIVLPIFAVLGGGGGGGGSGRGYSGSGRSSGGSGSYHSGGGGHFGGGGASR
ncbi:MAG: TPM domain-containing protein [Succinivibrionaceae bacterium]|nr:TPM domain-containing protein [Succinivibrionaceae bacterium]